MVEIQDVNHLEKRWRQKDRQKTEIKYFLSILERPLICFWVIKPGRFNAVCWLTGYYNGWSLYVLNKHSHKSVKICKEFQMWTPLPVFTSERSRDGLGEYVQCGDCVAFFFWWKHVESEARAAAASHTHTHTADKLTAPSDVQMVSTLHTSLPDSEGDEGGRKQNKL